MIAYTHWAYFPDESTARGCAREMVDYLTRILPPEVDRSEWLFLAGRDVELGDLVEHHDAVKAIVTQHGGKYDGGEAGSDFITGKYVTEAAASDRYSTSRETLSASQDQLGT